jgi:hypothetical protein
MKDFEAFPEQYKGDGTALDYLGNVRSAVFSYLRTHSFDRDVFVGYLDSHKQAKEAQVKNIGDLASVGSFSSGSLLVKLAAFLGLGSLADVFTLLKYQPTPGLPFNLGAVIIGGLVGVFAAVLIFRWYAPGLVARVENKTYEEELTFWKYKARPSYKGGLKALFGELKTLASAYYPDYTEEVLKDEASLDAFIDGLLPEEDLYQIIKAKSADKGWTLSLDQSKLGAPGEGISE